jgi:hypothetical protein
MQQVHEQLFKNVVRGTAHLCENLLQHENCEGNDVAVISVEVRIIPKTKKLNSRSDGKTISIVLWLSSFCAL